MSRKFNTLAPGRNNHRTDSAIHHSIDPYMPEGEVNARPEVGTYVLVKGGPIDLTREELDTVNQMFR